MLHTVLHRPSVWENGSFFDKPNLKYPSPNCCAFFGYWQIMPKGTLNYAVSDICNVLCGLRNKYGPNRMRLPTSHLEIKTKLASLQPLYPSIPHIPIWELTHIYNRKRSRRTDVQAVCKSIMMYIHWLVSSSGHIRGYGIKEKWRDVKHPLMKDLKSPNGNYSCLCSTCFCLFFLDVRRALNSRI